MIDWIDRWRREHRRAERPGHPDEIHLRSFLTNWGERRFLVEGRKLGLHLGDKAFAAHPDALAFAQMEARWHGAKLIDHTGASK